MYRIYVLNGYSKVSTLHYNKKPLKISELNELLTPSNTHKTQIQHDLDASKHIEANFIAEILINLKLKTPRLSRNTVIKMHSGELHWTNSNGESVSLTENFDFSLLEELGILTFEHNWVRINADLPSKHRYDEVDDSLIPLLRFVENLRNIQKGYSNLTPTTFVINKATFNQIIPFDYKFEHYNIEIVKDSVLYTVNITEHGWGSEQLINHYFWKKFVQYEAQEKIINKYYDLRQSYIDVIGMPNEDIFDNDEKSIFIAFCKSNIDNSTLLQMSLKQYHSLLISQRGFEQSLFFTSRTTHINLGLNEKSKKEIKPDEVVSQSLSLEQVIKMYRINKEETFESDINLIDWSRHNNQMHHSNLIYSSLRSVIDYDIFIGYPYVSSRGYLDELFVKSKNNIVLRHLLLNQPSIRNYNNFNLYLLSKPDCFLAGFYKLLHQIQIKYRSNNDEYKKTIENVVELLCVSTINVAINNSREDELSKLVLYLAKNNINSHVGADSIELSCLNFLISNSGKDNIINIFQYLLSDIKLIELDRMRAKYKLYVLFKMLECCKKELTLSKTSITYQIENEILEHYKQLFDLSLSNDSSCLDADSFYDELYWEGLNNMIAIEHFTKILPTKMNLMTGFSSNNEANPIQFMQTIKNYIQVLINLFSLPESNNTQIERIIRDIIIEFGFESKEVRFPIFNDSYTASNNERYDLWGKLTKIINDFSDALFDELLMGLSSKAPLSAILTLYANTHKSIRRNRVLSVIDSTDYSEKDESSIDFIEKSFSLALESSKLDLARLALNKANLFFENHRYKEMIKVKEMIFQWATFEYKYDLLVSYYSDDQLLEKEKSINDLPMPKLEEKFKNNINFKHWITQADIFRRYVIGLANLSENPKKSNAIFESLYKENQSNLFSHLIFTSKIQQLISDEATINEFQNTINEYVNCSKNFSFDTLPLNYKSDYLYALYLSKKYDDINYLCSNLNMIELNYKPITITFCKTLRIKKNYLSAQELIDNYKKFHTLEASDSDLNEQVEKIAISIKERLEPLQREMMKSEIIHSYKSNNELKTIFREIKNKSIEDLASILSNDEKNSVDNFLYQEILACVKELLIRAKNLEILNKNKNEDLINDWCVSLINHRLSWFGLTLCDQKRTGKAPSGIGVGESDGLILDNRNVPISIFEALNLSSLNNTTIDEHLNKISDYDLLGLSPVFIVSYCYFSNFTSKVKKYLLNLKSKQYDGFKSVNTDSHEIIGLITKPTLITAVESRFREDKQIAIYHILIDLKI